MINFKNINQNMARRIASLSCSSSLGITFVMFFCMAFWCILVSHKLRAVEVPGFGFGVGLGPRREIFSVLSGIPRFPVSHLRAVQWS